MPRPWPPAASGTGAGAPVLADVARYAEIHIEQGKSLEETGTQVGIVDRTWAASKYRVTVDGAQSHTGSTRMEDRRDALYGAALVIAAARDLAAEFAPGQLHTSVSEMYVLPSGTGRTSACRRRAGNDPPNAARRSRRNVISGESSGGR